MNYIVYLKVTGILLGVLSVDLRLLLLFLKK